MVLCGFELPINAVVFSVLGDMTLATWGIAGVVALVLITVAHLLGGMLNPPEENDKNNRWLRRIWIGIFFLLPVVLIAAIAAIRWNYLQQEAKILGGFQLDQRAILIFFGALNILVYIAAVFASKKHDTKAAVQKARLLLKEAHRKVARIGQKKAQICVEREKEFLKHQVEIDIVEKEVNRLKNIYQDRNFRFRRDRADHPGEYPKSYGKKGETIKLDRPPSLDELDHFYALPLSATAAGSPDGTNGAKTIGNAG